jgi:chromosome segregation ATPase
MSNEQLTETIEKALEAPAKPYGGGLHKQLEEMKGFARALLAENKRLTKRLETMADKAAESFEIAVEENVSLVQVNILLQQTREELTEQKNAYNQVFDSRAALERELEQVKAELNEWYKTAKEAIDLMVPIQANRESIHIELCAKDKVLEWYGDKENYNTDHLSQHGWLPIDKDEGEKARDILSQYRTEESNERE